MGVQYDITQFNMVLPINKTRLLKKHCVAKEIGSTEVFCYIIPMKTRNIPG